ncbi:MAG: biotin/lipoyl-binding protein [Candidatus Atribacteria bacterium]|nr:biotin/lipoyl-binding protein [Candidatus Atribacteria bacterium]
MRKFQIKVDGKVYEVEVEEVEEKELLAGTISFPQPIATKAKEDPVSQKGVKPTSHPAPTKSTTPAVSGEEVAAPMPGKVLQLKVSEGDSVKDGDTLLILEAMKMENEIIANVSGNIKKINVSANDMVDTGDVLMVIG